MVQLMKGLIGVPCSGDPQDAQACVYFGATGGRLGACGFGGSPVEGIGLNRYISSMSNESYGSDGRNKGLLCKHSVGALLVCRCSTRMKDPVSIRNFSYWTSLPRPHKPSQVPQSSPVHCFQNAPYQGPIASTPFFSI